MSNGFRIKNVNKNVKLSKKCYALKKFQRNPFFFTYNVICGENSKLRGKIPTITW